MKPKPSMRVVIVDPQVMFREVVKSAFAKDESISFVGEASDGHEALEVIGKKFPNLVLTEVYVPRLNGPDLTRRILKLFPKTKVLAVSGCCHMQLVTDMLAARVSGYILKTEPIERLFPAMEKVMGGNCYLSPEIAKGVIDGFVNNTNPRCGRNVFNILTERQREVLQLTAEGYSVKELAGAIDISAKTVEQYRRVIMEKLDIHNLADLIRYAIREGIASLDCHPCP